MVLRFSVRAGRASGGATEGGAWQVADVPCAGEEISIGRQPGATVELPFPAVSARHARVFREARGYRVEDLGSVNGTMLGGRRLLAHQPLPLAAGEVLDCGGVQIRFDGELPEPASPSLPEGTETLARRLVHDVFCACPPGETARLVGVAGPGAGCELALLACERALLVGRGENCDLVLPDEDVSREHAAFRLSAAGITVQDLQSKNGVEVQGQRLVGSCRLHDGDVLRIGETTMRLVDPEDRYLRQVQEAGAGQKGAIDDAASPAFPPAGPEGSRLAVEHGRSRLPLVASAFAVVVFLLVLGLVLALVLGCRV
jgi:pSer/pThr/pTyr-binding forkhead associated (FHA) protein